MGELLCRVLSEESMGSCPLHPQGPAFWLQFDVSVLPTEMKHFPKPNSNLIPKEACSISAPDLSWLSAQSFSLSSGRCPCEKQQRMQ